MPYLHRSIPQKSPIISGYFAKIDLQLKASCESLPSCTLDVRWFSWCPDFGASCHTPKRVMSASHVTLVSESCHTEWDSLDAPWDSWCPDSGASCHTPETVLQCAMIYCVVCYSVLQCVAVCCSVLQCVAVCCSVLQCAMICCVVFSNVLQCAMAYSGESYDTSETHRDALSGIWGGIG